MEQKKNIIITDTLSGIGTEAYKGYLGHALCLEGRCHIMFNGKGLEMKRGDLLIVRQGRLVQSVKADSSFRVIMIYIAAPFIEVCTPQCNYGMKGQLALFLNPIMHLTEEQFEQCRRNFDNLQIRIAQTAHHFYHEMLINIVQSLIIDFFDFHASLYQEQDVSTQYATLMSRFLSLLENGEYRTHREVTWYADKLCVTSKYLSEVSKSVSGYAANFWINRYRCSTSLVCCGTSHSPLCKSPTCSDSHHQPILAVTFLITLACGLRTIEVEPLPFSSLPPSSIN